MLTPMRWMVRGVAVTSLSCVGACGGGASSKEAGPSGPAAALLEAYLKASNTGGGDAFGDRIALSGDTLVIGAPFEDSSATGVNGNQADESALFSGAAYVFTRVGTTWTQQAYLKGSNTDYGDLFGCSVAISGDTLVVGASSERSGATGVNGDQSQVGAADIGAAYVFVRTSTSWTQQAYLKASNAEFRDRFGTSVAVSGDTIVVGAIWEDGSATGVNGNQADNGAADSGAAYVFSRTGTAWTQQSYVKASNAGEADNFGHSLALSDDTLAVGALLEASNATGVNGNQADNSAEGSGAVYVFTRSGASLGFPRFGGASGAGGHGGQGSGLFELCG